jgi:hypothetical protein
MKIWLRTEESHDAIDYQQKICKINLIRSAEEIWNIGHRTSMPQCRMSASKYQCINVVSLIYSLSEPACDEELLPPRSYSDSGNSIQFHQSFAQSQRTAIGGMNFRE